MCGIAGLIFKDDAPDWGILSRMAKHQTMRGPDHMGIEVNCKVGFAHNRLSIIDTSATGNQPMQTDRWALIYNGEIYNYQELQRGISVRQWYSYNDTETLLYLIDEKGVEATLDLLEGMFAFAAYDKIDKVLWLAVDPMGIKPVYFYHDERNFAFASSPGALTNCKDRWHLDVNALNDFLALGATYQSLFSGIEKLMPGCVMRRTAEGFTGIKKYYTPKVYENITTSEILMAVQDSIQSVKVSDVPVSVFLSGGIDSTVVASGCQFMNGIHLASPEESYAQYVAKKYNIDLKVIHPKDYSAAECLEDYAMKSGDCSMAAIVPYITAKEVSKLGKVAISANGADELFFGYDRTDQDIITAGQLRHIFRASIFTDHWSESAFKYKDNSRLFELATYVQFDLNKTLDFASMCHGVEMRVPYLNRKVVDMALSLPRDRHVKGRYTKAILKDHLKDQGFSSEFVNRPKVGFSLHYSPTDYDGLKLKGLELLKEMFLISPKLTGRDARYFEASAAAFYCWFKTWESKLK